tara:strand:- start:243 stop:416 length:174 start_codon:yes stop_codon:yes gene_type:complete
LLNAILVTKKHIGRVRGCKTDILFLGNREYLDGMNGIAEASVIVVIAIFMADSIFLL